jgi:hypothetical protein
MTGVPICRHCDDVCRECEGTGECLDCESYGCESCDQTGNCPCCDGGRLVDDDEDRR